VNLNKEQQNNFQTLDIATFEILFKSEFKGLCHFAIQYVKDLDTSKEIVQEAFLNLWQKKDMIDLSKPVKSYLFTSVRNRCLNYLRDHKKFNTEIIELEDAVSGSYFQQPDKLVEAEIRQKIDSALHELPEKCRKIFILSRYERLKYQEIADRLEISIKTVESQMSKALQHMRVRLTEFLT
jgi:RNA polymerase sigma-70 factor, ECF subfamily